MKRLFAFGILFVSVVNLFAVQIVELKMKERDSVSRYNEPVLIGVPLPESLYTRASRFTLRDSTGNVIPCEFRPAVKWWRDRQSIRWLHLDFQTNLVPHGERSVWLNYEADSQAAPATGLAVADEGAKFRVTTGPLSFTVKKQGFNLFDEVWVDETGSRAFDASHQIVASHAKGFSLLASGVRYYSSNDAASAVTLERSGPLCAVLKAEGRLKDGSGNAKYYFVTRIYAYANSRAVRVVFSFENRDASVSAFVNMSGLNLELPATLSSKRYALGARPSIRTGTLSAADTAFLLVQAVDTFAYGLNGTVTPQAYSRYSKNIDLGWASLSDGSKGVAAAVQWFWQNYPASIEVNGSGLLNIGLFSHRYRWAAGTELLYPPRQASNFQVYSGMAKTHEIRFLFFNDDSVSEVRNRVAGVNSRLYPLAPAYWYTRGTKAAANLVEKGKSDLFTPNYLPSITTYETGMWNAGIKCLGNSNIDVAGKFAYDYFGWGDNPHQQTSASALMWNGNYYDLPYLMFQHFFRTLDYRILDYAVSHTAHIQDLHLVHFESVNSNNGGSRYCPPTNHIGADNTAPDVQGHASHHKTLSVFLRWDFLCEERSLDVALKGADWIRRQGTSNTVGDQMECYARRPGHVLNTLLGAWKHTFDIAYRTNIYSNLNTIRTEIGTGGIDMCNTTLNQRWMAGLLLEPLIDCWYVFRDSLFVKTVKQIVDSTGSGMNSNAAYAMAFLGRFYNSPVYFSKAITMLNGIGDGRSFGHHEKDYAERCRSVLQSLTYFAIPDSVDPTRVENGAGESPAAPVVEIIPNPFNPAATISLRGFSAGLPVRAALYDVAGKVVRTFEAAPGAGGTREWVWSAADGTGRAVGQGVYLLKVTAGSFTTEKKITYLK